MIVTYPYSYISNEPICLLRRFNIPLPFLIPIFYTDFSCSCLSCFYVFLFIPFLSLSLSLELLPILLLRITRSCVQLLCLTALGPHTFGMSRLSAVSISLFTCLWYITWLSRVICRFLSDLLFPHCEPEISISSLF